MKYDEINIYRPNMKANFSIKLGRKENQLATSNMPLTQTTPMYLYAFIKMYCLFFFLIYKNN